MPATAEITSPVQLLRIYHVYISAQRDESSRPPCGLYRTYATIERANQTAFRWMYKRLINQPGPSIISENMQYSANSVGKCPNYYSPDATPRSMVCAWIVERVLFE
jgi:hypothetical protein